jgi:hypothetical protein
MKISHIVPEFVTSFPAELEPGHLYVSAQFSSAAHLCALRVRPRGCHAALAGTVGAHVRGRRLDEAVDRNWALPCQSHYVIDHSTIRWGRGFTRDEIQPAASRTTGSWMQSTPPRTATARQRHGTCGQNPCPSVGRFHDRERGDQLAAHGEIPCPLSWGGAPGSGRRCRAVLAGSPPRRTHQGRRTSRTDPLAIGASPRTDVTRPATTAGEILCGDLRKWLA